MAEVVLDQISKVYDNGFAAVTDLSLDIADGEFLVLVGPSGCGKSTALRMIAGLETISSGKMLIGDRVINDVQPKDRDIAMVFQNYALYPHMTVYDNIGFALKLAKIPRDEIKKRVDNAARILELTENLDKKPGQLSGGQRQRVAMGRAIVRDPSCFLMDEPLSNLDAKLRVQMRAEIAALQRELGVTTFYVTHDQVEAMTMGDRVAVIKRGFLQQVAAPQELYDHPDNLFVAGFIGSPAMNLMNATLRHNGTATTVELGTQTLEVDEELVAERPALQGYIDKPLAVGIRPEDMEDVAVVSQAPESRHLRSEATLVEALGSDVLVHFNLDAEPVLTQEVLEAAEGAGEEVADLAGGDGTHAVARFNPRSRVVIGDQLDIVVDTHRLHFFDLDSGLAIRD
jgi:multiple sugar transport system ATP-binding protein